MAEEKEESNSALKWFLDWSKMNNLALSSKVRIGTIGSCHRYGMVGADTIMKGETIFEIPRSLVLSPANCSVAQLLRGSVLETSSKEQRSGWAPLLVALMYEYTNQQSFWKPYLNLVPSPEGLDQPVFWTQEERQALLCNTGILKNIERDLRNIEEEYSSFVLPFLKKHDEYFDIDVHTLSLYKHMVGFVMAYSFTEESPDLPGQTAPVMVPMADILNHHSNNNAHLEFGPESLKMVATDHIKKGQEVFNTYGKLGNDQLLQLYGFVEMTPNPYDSVDIPAHLFHKTITFKLSSREKQLVDAKFQFMKDTGFVCVQDDIFRFNKDGCSLWGPDLVVFFKILHLTAAKFCKLINELSNSSQVISEEFQDIEDNALNTSDLTQTCRILNEIFCREAKIPYAKKRKTTSRSVHIANEACETTLLKRKITSQDCTINNKIAQDFERNRNIEKNETLDVASERDDNCASKKLADGNHGYEKYKETQKIVKKLMDVEEQREVQPINLRRKKFQRIENKEDDHKDREISVEEGKDLRNKAEEGKIKDLGKQLEENLKKRCTKKKDGGRDNNDEAQFEKDVEGREEEKIHNCEEECKEEYCEEMLEEWEGGEGMDESDDERDNEEENEVEEDLLVEEEEGENSSEDEDDENDEEQVLTYEQIAAFPKTWRTTLSRTAEAYLQDRFGRELKEEHLKSNANRHEKAVQQLKLGEMCLLKKIIKCTEGSA